MNTKVMVLATCRNPDLFKATTLVFDTIRVGFPDADILVFDNANSELHRSELRECCKKAKTKFVHLQHRTIHHQWIEDIVTAAMGEEKSEPFWFCDTDIVFWDEITFRGANPGVAIAGRYIPSFQDVNFTRCWTHERLHPSLLYVNPKVLKEKLDEFIKGFPPTPFNPLVNLFHPIHLPPDEFHDTCGLLHRAVGGHRFSEQVLDRYDHLFCGTISDMVKGDDGKMTDRHLAMMADPMSMRGLWKHQDNYFNIYHNYKDLLGTADMARLF